MNILLINHYAGTPDLGMEFRPYYFAKEWIALGHNVHIIAADYSHLRRKNPKVEKDFEIEDIDGITFHWVKTKRYSGNGIQRAVSIFQFVTKLLLYSKKIIKDISPDVVICSSTYPLDTFAGQRIRRISSKNVAYIHELHDPWPATLIELGGMSKYNPFVVLMQLAENSACRNADYFISLAQYTEDHLAEHGLKSGKFACIPLGAKLDEWVITQLNDDHHRLLKKYKESGDFVVGYFGGHALSNALDVLLEVAALIKTKNAEIRFVLVGDGVEKDRLINKASDLGLDNIDFLKPVSKREIPALLEYFDLIYIGTYKNNLYRFGMCLNKMVDAMLSGKPLVCSITAPVTWAEQSGCAITVPSEDTEKICEAILKLHDMSDEQRKIMGQKGIDYVKEELNIEVLAKRVILIAQEILERD